MSDNNVVAPALSELLTHSSEKWRGFAPDVLPLPVMEMDFPIAHPIRDVLIEMVNHSDLGYLGPVPELADGFAAFCHAFGAVHFRLGPSEASGNDLYLSLSSSREFTRACSL